MQVLCNASDTLKGPDMTEYLVTWSIFVEARSPEEAARGALAAQRSPESDATCFDVYDETGLRRTVVCLGPGDVQRLPEQQSPPGPHLKLVKTSRG